MKIVTAEQIGTLISNIQHGKLFSLVFDRALPKCECCGRKSKKWLADRPETCPHCGGKVSYERRSLAQTGVHNPSDKSIAPKGTGETFAQKREKGLIGFYDPQAKGYRECHLDSIKRVVVDGEEYVRAR